jgi:hypothetical protein
MNMIKTHQHLLHRQQTLILKTTTQLPQMIKIKIDFKYNYF